MNGWIERQEKLQGGHEDLLAIVMSGFLELQYMPVLKCNVIITWDENFSYPAACNIKLLLGMQHVVHACSVVRESGPKRLPSPTLSSRLNLSKTLPLHLPCKIKLQSKVLE